MISSKKLLYALIVVFTFVVVGMLHANQAYACANPIPLNQLNIFPHNCTSNVGQPSGTDYNPPTAADGSQPWATDVVNNYSGENSNYYLWCKDGGHVIELQNSNPSSGSGSSPGCDRLVNGNYAYTNSGEWAYRPEGQIGQTSVYEVIANQFSVATGGITVTVKDACRSLYDNNGWEDHSRADLYNNGDLNDGFTSISANNVSCDSNDDGNITLPESDLSFSPASQTYGPNMEMALVTVKDTSIDNDNEKNFGVEVTPGNYIGPADERTNGLSSDIYINIKNPKSSTLDFKAQATCTSQTSGWCPNYGNLNANNNDESNTYTFYFSPDCNYTNDQYTQYPLEWRDGQGSQPDSGPTLATQPDHDEEWVLYDVTGGEKTKVMNEYDYVNGVPNFTHGDQSATFKWQEGHIYEWQWTLVDRGHGLSIKLPFSEYNASSTFNCPQQPPQPSPGTVAGTCNEAWFNVGPSYNGDSTLRYALYESPAGGSIPSNGWYSGEAISSTSGYPDVYSGSIAQNNKASPNRTYTYSLADHNQINSGNVTWYMVTYNYTSSKDKKTDVTTYTAHLDSVSGPQTIGPCNTAVCSISVSGALLGGNNMEDGQTFGVTVAVTNTGINTLNDPMDPYYAYPLSGTATFNGGPNFENDVGQDLAPGNTGYAYFSLTAPSDASSHAIYAYPDYWGRGPIGSLCSATINSFEPFTLSPIAQGAFDDDQDPSSFTYETGVDATGSQNVSVPVPTSSCMYQQTLPSNTCAGGGTFHNGPVSGGTYPPGTKTYTQGPNATYNGPFGTIYAGMTYCSEIDMAYTSGWVGPGGTVLNPSGGGNFSDCPSIKNKPFFKVLNNGVSAGGDFEVNNTGCSGGGTLASWNNNTGTYPTYDFGAGSTFTALAANNIVGYASSQISPSSNPVGLTFANSGGVPVSADKYSPSLGGGYGNSSCFTDWPSGSGNTTSFTGNTTIGPKTILPGQNVSYFVKGNVYIGGNILYQGDNGVTGGTSVAWNTPADVPSFVLHATGNIYISPTVNELDGLYVSTGSGNHIYTCGQADYTAMTPNNLYGGCNQQLTVYGDFEADNVDLMRTFGSLRDEKPSGGSSYSANGSNYSSCTSVTPPARCKRKGSAVYSTSDYSVSYNMANGAENDYKLTLNYSNYTPPGRSSWPPPVTGSYRYSLNVEVNGLTRISNWQLPTSGVPLTESIDLGALPANANITLQWSNKYWVDHNGNAETGVVTDFSYNPNLQINSINISSPSTPPSSLSCSNNGGGWITQSTCAAEVFDFSPELYLSNPAVEPPSDGTPQVQSITSLPPVL